MYQMLENGNITRLSDGAQFPTNEGNRDYRKYLAWLEAGNTPEPYVAPTLTSVDIVAAAHNEIDRLERVQLLPRAVREFMLLSLEERATSDELSKLPAYNKLKAFDGQIAVLRAVIRGKS